MTHYFIFGEHGVRLYDENSFESFCHIAKDDDDIVYVIHDTDKATPADLLCAYDGWNEFIEITETEYFRIMNGDSKAKPQKSIEPYDVSLIDFSELRNQKTTLVKTIDEFIKGFNNGNVIGNKNEIIDDLTGILNLIDSLQDYAVDELGMKEVDVYDFEAEDEREKESPEEYFARTNAQIIFQIRIEGEGLYVDDEMSKEFILSIVDDGYHRTIIKDNIRLAILSDVTDFPNEFSRDADGKLTYDYTMYEYGYAIEKYCRNIFNRKILSQYI